MGEEWPEKTGRIAKIIGEPIGKAASAVEVYLVAGSGNRRAEQRAGARAYPGRLKALPPREERRGVKLSLKRRKPRLAGS